MTTPTTTDEIEVSLENTPGTLADVAELLGEKDINILGFSCVAEGSEGTACFVTDDPDRAESALESAGFQPKRTPSVFLPVPNEPGQLGKFARKLGDSGVNIERSFVATDTGGDQLGIGFAVDDVNQAQKVLQG